jgi:hypothetical protein
MTLMNDMMRFVPGIHRVSYRHAAGSPNMIRILLILVSLGLVLNACHAAQESRSVRFATFNVAMGLSNEGELQQKLRSGDDQRLQQVATILQQVRPDVVLLNEFDFHPDNADLLRQNYLAAPQAGMEGLDFPFAHLAPVNTGVDSGLDLGAVTFSHRHRGCAQFSKFQMG